MANIGENIKALRERSGMSQEQLAARIGKTRSAVSQYESGKIIPRMGVIESIASVFMVDKTEVIGSDDVSGASKDMVALMDACENLTPEQVRVLLDTARQFSALNARSED